MRVELHFLGLVIDLVYINTEYWKQHDKYKGIPVFYNEGGLLYFEFPYGEAHSRLLERMLTINYELYKRGYPLDDGKVMFYDANGDTLKTWKFKDGFIKSYKVTFDPNGNGLMVRMIISPAIQDYGCKVVRSWHVTPIEEETYKSPVYATEDTEPKVLDYYLTDLDGNRIDKTKIGEKVYLNIETKKLVGQLLSISLSDKNVDFQV